MPRLVTIGAITALALLVASYGGVLHPLGDSLAVFRLALVLAVLVLLPGFLKWPRVALGALVFALLALSGIGGARLDREAPGAFSVYQKNMWFANSDLAALESDIRTASPDIVLLQELSWRNRGLPKALRDAYPNQHVCRYSRRSGVAVLTRLPVTHETFCGEDVGLAGLRIETDTGPVWVMSLHLLWPFPLRQMDQVHTITAALEKLPRPVILGGDFNAVPWSEALRRLTQASGTKRAGGARPSFYLGPVPLPVDHVLAPGGGASVTRGFFGSDHRGLLAQVHLLAMP